MRKNNMGSNAGMGRIVLLSKKCYSLGVALIIWFDIQR